MKKRRTKKQILIERVKTLLNEVKAFLPVDLKKFPEDLSVSDRTFTLSNGMDMLMLNETDIEYGHPKHAETVFGEYDELSVSDLEEVISILEDVSVLQYKTMKRASN